MRNGHKTRRKKTIPSLARGRIFSTMLNTRFLRQTQTCRTNLFLSLARERNFLAQCQTPGFCSGRTNCSTNKLPLWCEIFFHYAGQHNMQWTQDSQRKNNSITRVRENFFTMLNTILLRQTQTCRTNFSITRMRAKLSNTMLDTRLLHWTPLAEQKISPACGENCFCYYLDLQETFEYKIETSVLETD